MMVMMMVVMMTMIPWVDCCDTHNLTLACLCHMAVSSPMRVTCSRPRRPWETGLAPNHHQPTSQHLMVIPPRLLIVSAR